MLRGVTGDGCGTAKFGTILMIWCSIADLSRRNVAVGSSLDEEKEAKFENFSMDLQDIWAFCFLTYDV